MKKFIFLLIAIFSLSVFSLDAQKVNKSFTDVTVQGDTVAFDMSRLVPLTVGVVIYDYTLTNTADSLAFLQIEGSNDNSNWFPLTGTAVDILTNTTGAKQAYQVNSLRHLYYRLNAGALTGDTVTISNVRVIFKDE